MTLGEAMTVGWLLSLIYLHLVRRNGRLRRRLRATLSRATGRRSSARTHGTARPLSSWSMGQQPIALTAKAPARPVSSHVVGTEDYFRSLLSTYPDLSGEAGRGKTLLIPRVIPPSLSSYISNEAGSPGRAGHE